MVRIGILTLIAAIAASVVFAATAFGTPTEQKSAVGPLKACAFVASNSNNSTPTVNVKVSAANGAGMKGTFTIAAPGLHATRTFTLRPNGVALVPYTVQSSGTSTIAVKLSSTPALTRTVKITVNTATSVPKSGCVATASTGATAAAAAAATATPGHLKACAFVASNSNNSTPTVNVKVVAANGAGTKGTFTLSGPGNHTTKPFTLGHGGLALVSFTVRHSGTTTIALKLASHPAETRTLKIAVNTASAVAKSGCTAS